MTTTSIAGTASWTGRRLPAVIDYATGSHARAAVMLIVFCLVAFLPGFFQIPPVDRDEARFAQATKQMVQSGNYVDIRFQGSVRYKKPVGIYWLQAGVVNTARALGMKSAPQTIWLYRIPSLIGATGAVLLTYWLALAFLSRRGAVLAALMLGGSVLLGVEARLAKTDAMLLFTVVAAMGALARLYVSARAGSRSRQDAHDRSRVLPAIFWTALAGGVLLKGPVILMIVGLALVTLAIADRSYEWMRGLRPLPGVVWFLLLVLPWFIAILSRSGDTFLVDSVGHDMLAKIASGQEAHGAPPGTYFVLFWLTFWPGAILAGLAVPAVWKTRRETATRFLLAWLLPSWVVFELVATKLPHYVLPLYPAVAILIAGVVERGGLSRQRWLEFGTIGWVLVPLILTGVAVAGLVLFGRPVAILAWILAAAAVAFGVIAWRLYRHQGAERGLLHALIASVLLAASIYGVALPSMTRLFPSVLLADVLQHSHCHDPLAASAGYQEPSLVFLAGTETTLTDGSGAADFLSRGSCRFAFVEAHAEPAFLRRAKAIGLHYATGPRYQAVNYSHGRLITVSVYRSEAGS